MQNHNFLALDPSLTSTGYCVMSMDGTIIKAGRITTSKSEGSDNDRINKILNFFNDNVIHKDDIWEIATEDGFSGKNLKTGLLLSKLRGAIFGKFNYLKFFEYPPSFARKNMGLKGNTSKEEVADFIAKAYPHVAIKIGPYKDTGKNKTSDIYDAIAIAMAHRNCKKEKTGE